MNKPLMAAGAALMLIATTVQAQPHGGGYYPYARGPSGMGPPPQASAPSQVDAPEQILHQGLDRMKRFLSQGVSDPQQILAFLDKEIAPYFDFDLMARWILGRDYYRMEDAEKSQFTQRLKVMFFTALSKNLKSFSNPPPRIDIFGSRARRDARRVTVGALVRGGTMYERPVRLQFRFYRGDSGWKVFDVTANGVSAVAYYRQHFNQLRNSYYYR